MAAVGHERWIRANTPAAGRPQTADPAGGQGGFRLGPTRAHCEISDYGNYARYGKMLLILLGDIL